MKNGLFTRIYKKAFVFVVVLLVFGFAFGFASLNFQKIKANTSYYEDISEYVVNDWQNYTDFESGDLHLINNGDGTFTCYGSTSTIKEVVLPLTITTISSTQYWSYFLALAVNNSFTDIHSYIRLYFAYNNGANVINTYAQGGNYSSGSNASFGNRTGFCLVLRFDTTTDIQTPIIITPFLYMRALPYGVNPTGQQAIDIYTINKLLGPTGTPTPEDLTKVNYITNAFDTSLIISTQTNMSFGNQLQNLIQYSFEAGDTITVDNVGETALYIDLLTMTAGNDSYIMRFNNDAQSNDYLSVYLYKNNDFVYFYNDNTGEITAGNITAFRTWGVDAINNGATITGGSQFNNNIINKIFVYSTGTNYETGYTNGYADGYDAGEVFGYEEGTANGWILGYADGYDQGAIDGLDTSWLVNLFQAVNTFFDITILPGIKIGTIFAIPFVLSIAWVIIRILRGGGYGD